MPKVLTTCLYCGCGCNLYLDVEEGRVVGVTPSASHPVSKGMLCIKGFNLHEFIHDERRLTQPLIKKGGKFKEAGWEKALNLTAKRLGDIKDKYGPDSIACLASAKCTNEENYLMQKFARAVVGTNNIDHCARLCHSSTVAGLAAAFGSGAMTNSIDEIEDAQVILLTGSNTSEQHPLIASRIIAAVEKGAKLLIVDPRRIPLSNIASMHMQQRPGTDVAWINCLMNVIIKKNLHDVDFIESRTENFEELEEAVKPYTPKKAEEITGIMASHLKEAAVLYAESRSSIIYSMGITQHTTGTDNVLSLANLAMLTGNVGRVSTGVNPLRGHQNVQGACDMGALYNVYPGYQKAADPDVRKKFGKAWGVSLPQRQGLTVIEMMDAAGRGEVKALYVMGENPALSDPDSCRVEEALGEVEFLVVQDIFLTETGEKADVVLPAASFAEKEGTFTSTERRVQLVRKAIEPVGHSKPDWLIIQELSEKMGYIMSYGNPSEIMDEIASLTPIYGGIIHVRLSEWGLCWPCPTIEHSGTRFLHEGRFTRGFGRFHVVEYKPPDELTDEEYPFTLTTGRILEHFHTGTLTRKSQTLEREEPVGYVELNPDDARKLGVQDGSPVNVSSRRGCITPIVRITDAVKEGVVFIPFHYREAAANKLTNPALDPVAKIPEYKVCAVKVEAVE
jgi:formate dehydrogenase alpha subunit